MFLHFGILTYTGSWATPNLDITMFNPTQLDPNQWADAAVSAGMKFGVLTTRHHDGFALWNSQVSTFDVGSIPWQGGQGDVVRAYVDAFRAHDLLPGLYYSVWDSTHPVGGTSTMDNTPVTAEQLDYVKAQLTELLTNYGKIPLLIFDGWGWKMGHRQIPYQEIRALVKSLQPDCLMLDNSHLMSPWENDLAGVEEAQGNMFVPADNTFPAVQMQKINAAGGNDWFWAPSVGSLMTTSAIVTDHLKRIEPLWTNFLLNCPPNRDGLLPPEIVSRLAEVGAAWSPDTSRPPLPAQPPQIDVAYDPVGATATSGNGGFAVDGKDDWYTYSVWESSGALPQSVTVDLGQVAPGRVGVELRPALRRAGRPEHRRRDHVVQRLRQHRRRHVHDGRERGLARQRSHEDGVVRPGRRALRAPGSDSGQRRHRGGDRDRRRRPPLDGRQSDSAPSQSVRTSGPSFATISARKRFLS